MAQGIFQSVAPCDEAGTVYPNASNPRARSLKFALDPAVVDASKDQLDLKGSIELALSAIQRLFTTPQREPMFRRYFVQIASAAQVGLVGASAHPEVARQALAAAVADLIDEEGGRVKNKHLKDLAGCAVGLSVPVLLLYAIARFSVDAGAWLRPLLVTLEIYPAALSCFLLMLAGGFMGVVLSYAARTTTLGLGDLVNPDTDRLLPVVRLAVSAAWTLLVGYFLALGVVELKIGPVSSTQFTREPMLAFLVGAICGLSNLTLPGAVMKKVGDLVPFK